MPEPIRDPLAAVLRALRSAGPEPVVLIDGPSGAGKSTLADALVHAWPGEQTPTLVRLDDIYPGWEGLTAAIEQVRTELLGPLRAGKPGRWQRYDWSRGAPAGWTTVAPGHPLIVEGCGTLARGNAGLSDLRIWLDADAGLRKARALARDGDLFRSHWDLWQRQWADYLAREAPADAATLRLMTA